MDILKTISEKQAMIMIKSANLRKKYEEILIMRYVDNMSCQEIADLKGKELQTIRNEVCIARKKFYNKIGQYLMSMFIKLSILFFYAKIQTRGGYMNEQLLHDVMSLFGLNEYQAIEFIKKNKDDIEEIVKEEKQNV